MNTKRPANCASQVLNCASEFHIKKQGVVGGRGEHKEPLQHGSACIVLPEVQGHCGCAYRGCYLTKMHLPDAAYMGCPREMEWKVTDADW
jgi:hypothetical protein